MIDDLIVFKKTYDLILWLYPAVEQFPKSQRFILGQQILNSLIDFLKTLIETNQTRYKKELLNRASIELDKVRLLTRLAKDLRFLSLKKYLLLCEKINEVGKILGGLIRKFG